MAYVVARGGGRFEIRESLHTPRGPRSRTLVNFDVLIDDVLVKAARRAQRPFDVEAVIRSGRRAGAPLRVAISAPRRDRTKFLTASKKMANALGQAPSVGERMDPGVALGELLGFADAVVANQPVRPFEPLAFPPLARCVERRAMPAGASRP